MFSEALAIPKTKEEVDQLVAQLLTAIAAAFPRDVYEHEHDEAQLRQAIEYVQACDVWTDEIEMPDLLLALRRTLSGRTTAERLEAGLDVIEYRREHPTLLCPPKAERRVMARRVVWPIDKTSRRFLIFVGTFATVMSLIGFILVPAQIVLAFAGVFAVATLFVLAYGPRTEDYYVTERIPQSELDERTRAAEAEVASVQPFVDDGRIQPSVAVPGFRIVGAMTVMGDPNCYNYIMGSFELEGSKSTPTGLISERRVVQVRLYPHKTDDREYPNDDLFVRDTNGLIKKEIDAAVDALAADLGIGTGNHERPRYSYGR